MAGGERKGSGVGDLLGAARAGCICGQEVVNAGPVIYCSILNREEPGLGGRGERGVSCSPADLVTEIREQMGPEG